MPIDLSWLERSVVVVDAEITMSQLGERLRDRSLLETYVAVRVDGERWALVTPQEVLDACAQAAESWWSEPAQAQLAELDQLLADHLVEDVDAAQMTTPQAERLARQSRHRRLLVHADGEIIGVLGDRRRGGDGTTHLEWPAWAGARTANGGPSRQELAAEPPAVEPTGRWVNVEFDDHDRSRPLEAGIEALLVLDVDVVERIPGAATPLEYEPRTDDADVVELTVDLVSSDFEIYSGRQVLRLPRTGKSKNKARFDIVPRITGQAKIDAIILKDGNWVQQLTISVAVGVACPDGVVSVTSQGRPIDSARQLGARQAVLMVQPRDNAFEATWCLEGAWRAQLPFTDHAMAQAIDEARAVLRDVVYTREWAGQASPYLSGLDIPPDLDRQMLVRLADVGYRLFRRLFFDSASEGARRIGRRLVEAAERGQLRLQIVSRELVMPWGLLYLAQELDPERVDPERFLGLKHIVEQLPFEPPDVVQGGVIEPRPRLAVSLNLNRDIDREMGRSLTTDQVAYWQAIDCATGIDLVVRESADTVLSDLTDARTRDQIVYFFCHATTGSVADRRVADASYLTLTSQTHLMLRTLKARTPLGHALPGAPLVILNACASADLSPLFYDGFAPTLIGLGARGVIGTECDVPAVFAVAWARGFFDRLLAGEDLGEAVLAVRRELYVKHRNVLGLLYAVYCDADTRVAPALMQSSASA